MRNIRWIAVFVIVFAGIRIVPVLAAESGNPPVSSPTLGFFVDSEQRIRPILGLPGASLAGAPILASGRNYEGIVISPGGTYALAIRPLDGALVVISGLNATPAFTAIEGAGGDVSRIWISPRGSSAAVLNQGGKTLRIITGLPDSPTSASNVDVSLLDGRINALTVDDDGSAILATVRQASLTRAYSLSSGAAPIDLGIVGDASSVAFVINKRDGLVADSGANTLTLITNLPGTPATRIIAEGDAVRNPVGVAGAVDGTIALVATSDPAGVTMIDMVSGAANRIACACSPSTLIRLNRDIFQLSELGSIWLLNTDSHLPRAVFVAPPQDSRSRVGPADGGR